MLSFQSFATCLKFSLVAVFLLFLQPLFAQNSFADFEKAVEARRKELGTDLMVVVANKDTVLYQKLFGDITVRTPAPAGVASTWFTTALVLQLVDEGKLSLDDKVAQYLPVFGSYGKNYVTIRHCLTHMTGVQTEAFKTSAAAAKSKHASLDEEAAAFAKREIQNNAGEAFRYNPAGVAVAARVVEVVTKKKFEQLMRQRIFAPLGMRNTAFQTDDGSPASAATGARTTAADFSRFLQMLLNKGTWGGKKILSEEAVHNMRKIQVDPSMVKLTAKLVESFRPALGVWSADGTTEVGALSGVLVSPGYTGAWPVVDFGRGYSLIILPKNFSGEQNANVYAGLKGLADEAVRKTK